MGDGCDRENRAQIQLTLTLAMVAAASCLWEQASRAKGRGTAVTQKGKGSQGHQKNPPELPAGWIMIS